MPNTENNRRIAKNTVLLYFRMLLTMGVALYTSRVVLSTLGIEDFGIYNVVGGIVVMFGFINNSLSGATSRFITYELGRNDESRTKRVFSAALTIHIGIALIIFIFAETIGLWFLENKLVIPIDRMISSRIVYQLSILSCVIAVTQIPYNASIIAHERMNIYAYVSIFEVLLKLLVVYLLLIGNFDKLVLYAILMLIISTMVALIYRFYCIKNFEECNYKFTLDKEIMRPILSFSGYDIYGNFSWMIGNQGVNFLLNIFFGAVINAASGIANQVQFAVLGFANNFLKAVQPQIVKYYASNNIEDMQKLIFNSSKYAFLLLLLISLPLIVENDFILHLWLKAVPNYAIGFCQLALISSLVNVLFLPIGFAIHATGRIKRISFITGSFYLLALPISFFLLKAGYSPIIPYIVSLFILVLANSYNVSILKRNVPQFSCREFINKVLLVCALITVVSSLIPVLLGYFLPISWFRFLLVGCTSVITVSTFSFILGLDEQSKTNVIFAIRQKLSK